MGRGWEWSVGEAGTQRAAVRGARRPAAAAAPVQGPGVGRPLVASLVGGGPPHARGGGGRQGTIQYPAGRQVLFFGGSAGGSSWCPVILY